MSTFHLNNNFQSIISFQMYSTTHTQKHTYTRAKLAVLPIFLFNNNIHHESWKNERRIPWRCKHFPSSLLNIGKLLPKDESIYVNRLLRFSITCRHCHDYIIIVIVNTFFVFRIWVLLFICLEFWNFKKIYIIFDNT